MDKIMSFARVLLGLFLAMFFIFSANNARSSDLKRFDGTIVKVTFADPLDEKTPYLGEFAVSDGRGKTLTFRIDHGTLIKDYRWVRAYVAYLHEGLGVKVYYLEEKDGWLLAKDILALRP